MFESSGLNLERFIQPNHGLPKDVQLKSTSLFPSITYFSTAADLKGNRLVYGRPAFNTLLHYGCTSFTCNHVEARFKQDASW
jgi:hypothetical protein